MKQIKGLYLQIFGLCVATLFGMSLMLNAQAAPKEDGEVSSTYKIYVNRAANCVTVVTVEEDGQETPVKAFVCSCGRAGHETPRGTFRTSDYYEWCYMVDGTYGRYAIRVNKGIMFHSVPYLKKSQDTLEWDQYNLLGQSASLGCVRLCVADVKWIFDHCKQGTTVVIYDDAENPGALGKPETQKIDENSPCRDWDPTDTDARNPWLLEQLDGITYENFDYKAYAERYSDLKNAFGFDKKLLWNHYLEFGIKEGRIVEAREGVSAEEAAYEPLTYETFHAKDYADRYPDVKKAFGMNKKLLWKHYLEYGRKEGRIAR